jgi:hypothetical protein
MAVAESIDADLIVVGNKAMAGHIRKFTGRSPAGWPISRVVRS